MVSLVHEVRGEKVKCKHCGACNKCKKHQEVVIGIDLSSRKDLTAVVRRPIMSGDKRPRSLAEAYKKTIDENKEINLSEIDEAADITIYDGRTVVSFNDGSRLTRFADGNTYAQDGFGVFLDDVIESAKLKYVYIVLEKVMGRLVISGVFDTEEKAMEYKDLRYRYNVSCFVEKWEINGKLK
jgi:hypothetical protein